MSIDYTKYDIEQLTKMIEEQYYEIVKKQTEITYYENKIKVLDLEIPYLDEKLKETNEQNIIIKEQLQHYTILNPSLNKIYEVAANCYLHYGIYNNLYERYSELQKTETKKIKDECNKISIAMTTKWCQNDLNKELENIKLDCLRADIEMRQLDVKRRNILKCIALRKSIQKTVFYNFFIRMAENYVKNQTKIKAITTSNDKICSKPRYKLEKQPLFSPLVKLQHIFDNFDNNPIKANEKITESFTLPKLTLSTSNKGILKQTHENIQKPTVKIVEIVQNDQDNQQLIKKKKKNKNKKKMFTQENQLTEITTNVKKNVHFQLVVAKEITNSNSEIVVDEIAPTPPPPPPTTTTTTAFLSEIDTKENFSKSIQSSQEHEKIIDNNYDIQLSPNINMEPTTSPFFNIPNSIDCNQNTSTTTTAATTATTANTNKRLFDQSSFFQNPFNHPLSFNQPLKIQKLQQNNNDIIDKSRDILKPPSSYINNNDTKIRLHESINTNYENIRMEESFLQSSNNNNLVDGENETNQPSFICDTSQFFSFGMMENPFFNMEKK